MVWNLRLDEATKEIWSLTAEKRGLSLSAFVRQAVNEACGVEVVEAWVGLRTPLPPPEDCVRAAFHRKGVFCATCGW